MADINFQDQFHYFGGNHRPKSYIRTQSLRYSGYNQAFQTYNWESSPGGYYSNLRPGFGNTPIILQNRGVQSNPGVDYTSGDYYQYRGDFEDKQGNKVSRSYFEKLRAVVYKKEEEAVESVLNNFISTLLIKSIKEINRDNGRFGKHADRIKYKKPKKFNENEPIKAYTINDKLEFINVIENIGFVRERGVGSRFIEMGPIVKKDLQTISKYLLKKDFNDVHFIGLAQEIVKFYVLMNSVDFLTIPSKNLVFERNKITGNLFTKSNRTMADIYNLNLEERPVIFLEGYLHTAVTTKDGTVIRQCRLIILDDKRDEDHFYRDFRKKQDRIVSPSIKEEDKLKVASKRPFSKRHVHLPLDVIIRMAVSIMYQLYNEKRHSEPREKKNDKVNEKQDDELIEKHDNELMERRGKIEIKNKNEQNDNNDTKRNDKQKMTHDNNGTKRNDELKKKNDNNETKRNDKLKNRHDSNDTKRYDKLKKRHDSNETKRNDKLKNRHDNNETKRNDKLKNRHSNDTKRYDKLKKRHDSNETKRNDKLKKKNDNNETKRNDKLKNRHDSNDTKRNDKLKNRHDSNDTKRNDKLKKRCDSNETKRNDKLKNRHDNNETKRNDKLMKRHDYKVTKRNDKLKKRHENNETERTDGKFEHNNKQKELKPKTFRKDQEFNLFQILGISEHGLIYGFAGDKAVNDVTSYLESDTIATYSNFVDIPHVEQKKNKKVVRRFLDTSRRFLDRTINRVFRFGKIKY